MSKVSAKGVGQQTLLAGDAEVLPSATSTLAKAGDAAPATLADDGHPPAKQGKALARQQSKAVAIQGSPLDAILRSATDPAMDVDKMERLVALYERMKAQEAEQQFSEDMRAAQKEMRAVVRDARNTSTKSTYATLEAIEEKIRPIYTEYGFAMSFNSAPPLVAGNLKLVCCVRHRGGHKEYYELEGALDLTGPKGTENKTPIQAMGSTDAYLRRYLTQNIWHVALKDEDNDGNGPVRYLSDTQKGSLVDMLADCEMSEVATKKFLNVAGARSIDTIKAEQYDALMDILRTRAAKKQKGAA